MIDYLRQGSLEIESYLSMYWCATRVYFGINPIECSLRWSPGTRTDGMCWLGGRSGTSNGSKGSVHSNAQYEYMLGTWNV